MIYGCRSIAKNISENLDKNMIGYAAFEDDTVAGYITIGTCFFWKQGTVCPIGGIGDFRTIKRKKNW